MERAYCFMSKTFFNIKSPVIEIILLNRAVLQLLFDRDKVEPTKMCLVKNERHK